MSNKIYFQVIDRLRQITGNRESYSFSENLSGYEIFGNKNDSRIFFIYDFQVNKKIIQSADFAPYNFIQPSLNASKHKLDISKKFILNTPLFLDEKKHLTFSNDLKKLLKRCAKRIREIPDIEISDFLIDLFSQKNVSSNYIAKMLIKKYTELMIEELTGKSIKFSVEDLDHLSFITTVPTNRFLKDAEDCLSRINKFLDTDKLTITEFIAINSQLTMGFFPMVSTINVLLNDFISFSLKKQSFQKIDLFIKNFSYSNVTPLNFTSRISKKDISMDDITFKKGDIVYVFLTKISKCPFAKLTSMPFGMGVHKCPGNVIADSILMKTKRALTYISKKSFSDFTDIKISTISRFNPDTALLFSE